MITPVFVACYSSVCAICNSCCFQLMSWLFLYLIIFDCLLETPGKKYRNNIRSEMLSSFRDLCFLPSPLHPFIPPSLSLSFSFCLSFVAIYINPFVIGQQYFKWWSFYSCFSFFSLLMADFTMMAEVLQVQIPPVTTIFIQEPQCYIPAVCLLSRFCQRSKCTWHSG